MCLEAPLVSEAEHLVVDTCGVANTQHVDTPVYEFLADPVNRHVALCTDKYLTLAHQRLVDSLNKRRCLTRSWRPMNNRHVFSPQHFVDCAFLSHIEPGKRHRGKRETSSCHLRIEEIAEISQSVVLGFNDTVQGIEHHAVARLVKRQLHAYRLINTLQVERMTLRDNDHHAVALRVRYRAREREIMD